MFKFIEALTLATAALFLTVCLLAGLFGFGFYLGGELGVAAAVFVLMSFVLGCGIYFIREDR